MHPMLQAAGSSPVFEATAAPYLVLDRDLRIRAVNPSYARATTRDPEELLGQFMFDAFPDNPDDPMANGVASLGASLELVLTSGAQHDMVVQRYDIPAKGAAGGFAARTWAPINSPLIADGEVVGVLHHVEDLTEAHHLFSAAGQPARDQFTPALRHALRVVTRASRRGPLIRDPDRVAGLLAQRDRMWHELVHAAQRAPGKSCADVVCDVAARVLGSVEGIAITLYNDARAVLQVAATNSWTRQAEELQIILGEGPAPTAFASGEPAVMRVSPLMDKRWPAYAEAARNGDVTAVHAYPLQAESGIFGTMTLYCRTTSQRFPPHLTAAAWAEVVAVVLVNDLDADAIAGLSGATGLDEVNNAIGMLAASRDIALRDAEAQLRAAAYASGRPLLDVAREVIEGRGT